MKSVILQLSIKIKATEGGFIMKYLVEPLQTGKLLLKNRLVMPPMATAMCNEDGSLSKELLDYYDEKSQGGYIGLIIIEHSFITQQGRVREKQLSIADDSLINSYKELASTIHKNGSKVVMQINHAGGAAKKEVTGMNVVAPSAVINPFHQDQLIPKALTLKEIKDIVHAFASAARRVKEAGFDGVEIHSAHGYLLNQFFSPLTNKRTDEYGGDLSSRINIHLEVIKSVREAVGENFPILLRLGACDYINGGTTIADSEFAAIQFAKAGIDMLDISGGLRGYKNPKNSDEGYFSSLTEDIEKILTIPVILTGGITQAQVAEKLLSEKKADLIGVGRAIMNDSNWAKNALSI